MKILVIQTAFIGDIILATSIIEKLHQFYPDAMIDLLLKKGNEALFLDHPFICKIHLLNREKNKYLNLYRLIREIRSESYDWVINVHRFFSSGLITMLSGAKLKIGFDKNPCSFAYQHKIEHQINKNNEKHEIDRNLSLIEKFTDGKIVKPKLYPNFKNILNLKITEPYICIAPTSIWFTKQFPLKCWIELINRFEDKFSIYLLGSQNDVQFCQLIIQGCSKKIKIMAGKLSLLDSAALMKKAVMNFANDSAALHLASAVDAPITAIFCSTIPEFGFTPLSTVSHIVQTGEPLICRPCGLHGKKKCPQNHFKCSHIDIERLVKVIPNKP